MTVLPASATPLTVPPSALIRSVGAVGGVVSTITLNEPDNPLAPLALVAVAVNAWLPSLSAPDGVKLQIPLPSAVVKPISTPLLYRLMTALACAVPLSVGRVSLVVLPGATGPMIVPTSSSTLEITGAGGTPVNGASTLPAVPMLPAASCALTSRVCPLICGGFRVKVKLPEALAVAVPSTVPPLEVIMTVLFGSATPVSAVPLAFTASPVGIPGATVSTTIAAADDMPLVLPALSVAVMVNEWVPCASAVVGV